MSIGNDKSRTYEYLKLARERYAGYDLEGRAFILMHNTSQGYNFNFACVDADYKDSDDIGGLLEDAFHFIVDNTADDCIEDELYRQMDAMLYEELSEDAKKYDEYVNLDLGYVIPGMIDSWEVLT